MILLVLGGCLPHYEQHQIASIRAVGVTGERERGDAAYRDIESTMDGLVAIFRQRGFTDPLEARTRREGKRYRYAYHLSGERTYQNGYVYSGWKQSLVQCTVEIDRRKAVLRFGESEGPRQSGSFPLPESQRQHVRDTARLAAEYLRRTLPSHRAEIVVDEQPPRQG